MMEKIAWSMDSAICGLLKTMKSEYIEDTLNKGRLYFNFPSFYRNTELMSAQSDRYDSWEDIDAYHIMYAPIKEESANGITYGPAQKIADHSVIHFIREGNKHRPLCCFRAVKKEDFKERNNIFHFSLGETADRIIKEFGHDAYVFVYNPIELQRRLNKYSLFYGHEVFYGINNQKFREFVKEVNLECCGMFQKDEMYSWQKEYRIVLEPHKGESGFPIDIGEIRDIAFGGKIEDLRNGGLAFGDVRNPAFQEMLEGKQNSFL